MPAKPSYSHRLPDAIGELERLSLDWVDRKVLEEILGVSKTVAWRILRQCGAEPGPGNTRVCRRVELIESLRQLASEGTVHAREIRRREQLGDFLERIRPEVVAKRTPVARGEQALTLLSTTFKKLPGSVTLTSRSLHVDFFGTEDFVLAVGALVYALQNDYEAISEFIEGDG